MIPEGVALLKEFEGCKLTAYQDEHGVWTIGYGCTGIGIGPGLVWTQYQADQEFAVRIREAEQYVGIYVRGFATTPFQHAALSCFTFNEGVKRLATSSVLKFHRAQQYAQAADAFLLWDKVHIDGQLVEDAGLIRRRKAERLLYLMTGAANG